MRRFKGRLARAHERLQQRLGELLPHLQRTLRKASVSAIAARLLAELGDEPPRDELLISALIQTGNVSLGTLLRLEEIASELTVSYQAAATEAERREILVRHLRATVSDPVQLAKDIRATREWLDLDAVRERLSVSLSDRIDEVEICYTAVAALASKLSGIAATARSYFNDIALMLDHAERTRYEAVRVPALRAVTAVLRSLPAEQRLPALGADNFRLVRAWASDRDRERWQQVAALELCAVAYPKGAAPLLSARLKQHAGKDGMIVRRNVLCIVGKLPVPARTKLEVALVARTDPSEHVRQELARTLLGIDHSRARKAIVPLCLEDQAPRVRAFALRELAKLAFSERAWLEPAVHVCREVLRRVPHPLDLRVAFEAVRELSTRAFAPLAPETFVSELGALVSRPNLAPELVYSATALLRQLEAASSPAQVELCARFRRELDGLGEGKRRRLSIGTKAELGDIERALFVAAQSDMSVALRDLGKGRYLLTRGEPRALRLWRLLFELKTPAPDKRKNFVHSHARVSGGEIVIPPQGMAEVTPTRVPGERRYLKSVGGWGPFLPRVDDLLAACNALGKPVRLVTSFGTVVLRGPVTPQARARVYFKLSLGYERYARERERSLEAAEPLQQKQYSELCKGLGFSVGLTHTEGEVHGARFNAAAELVLRYLSSAMLPPWLERPVSYTLSPFGNTPWHLALVVWLVFAAYLLRAAFILHRIEKARASIPLTIGGWGTRGKSGSERLKAALFHALRYDVVVKTTGCEAMFIHARRDLPAREIFLYRPYDKATIWEQRDMLHTGSKLHAQVFLWECMALQPRFVDLLAREWMKDTVTTLTNAYPDHEDVMGPSGEDVARVIGRFMPVRGTTFTSEEQMLPLIREAAHKAGTRLVEIEPLEAELIPGDLLARFPYEEHPRNIALITRLAEHLEIDREYALVMMADYVVPDLGVLKTYPEVSYAGRRMAFSNGMSANERAGFMSNWTRLGFDLHDVDREPDLVTIAVVNNRADRVPRSRVFAEIFVRDVSVDHIVCIGTNLSGLVQFMREALELWLPELRVSGEGGKARSLERFDAALARLRVPRAPGALAESIARMLGALELESARIQEILNEPEVEAALRAGEGVGAALERALANLTLPGEDLRPDIVRHAERQALRQARVRAARAALEPALDAGDSARADRIVQDMYRELFLERVAVVERASATGDQVVDFIARGFAPGHRARVMGSQNIKGTGLDFVYRWLSIDVVYGALRRLEHEPAARADALSLLLSHTDWGLIDTRKALRVLTEIRDTGGEEWFVHRSLLGALCERLSELYQKKLRLLAAVDNSNRLDRVLGKIEPYVDHLDSMRRRRRAERLMNAIFEARIGQGRAALVMRELVVREKGGWLAKDVRRRWPRLAVRAARTTTVEPTAESAT